jgi:hypothetical protein
VGLSKSKAPSVIYEMLRSFVAVAETLNISSSVSRLGFTRQTIRRHIDDLEGIKGGKLLEHHNRQYRLTEIGRECIDSAVDLIANIEQWVSGSYSTHNTLHRYAHQSDDQKTYFYSQQHPLISVWSTNQDLMQDGLRAWIDSHGKLENEAFSDLKSKLVVYRKHEHEWLCMHLGEHSTLAKLLGATHAKSAIGKTLEDNALAPEFVRFITPTFDAVFEHGSPRFEHVCMKVSNQDRLRPSPFNYHQLLLPLHLPNGEVVVGELVAKSNTLKIDTLANISNSAHKEH